MCLRRGKLTISHLFFTDDLLLFGEASMEQTDVMFKVLHKFCGKSRQKVNGAKSTVWYFLKSPLSLQQVVRRKYGVPSTKELGKYLGIPITHGRMKHHQFGYLVDKVQGRLSGWKGQLLTRASRLVLIQVVTSAVPTYTMNCCKLLAKTIQALEKANKNFLWGASDGQRKMHVIAWTKVCAPNMSEAWG